MKPFSTSRLVRCLERGSVCWLYSPGLRTTILRNTAGRTFCARFRPRYGWQFSEQPMQRDAQPMERES